MDYLLLCEQCACVGGYGLTASLIVELRGRTAGGLGESTPT